MRLQKSANEISAYRNDLMVFAALGIFLMHVICENMLNFFPALDKVLVMYGSTGVDIFLFVSGMGCFCSLSKSSENQIKWTARHFLKVYIPYLLITVCFLPALPVDSIWDVLLKLSGLYFWVRGNDGTWFVPFIMLMYLLAPQLYKLFNQKTEKNSKKAFGCVLLISIVAILVFELLFPAYFELVGIGLSRIPSFIVGMWLGYLIKHNKKLDIKYILLFTALAVVELVSDFPDESFACLILKSCRSFVIMYVELWLFNWGRKALKKVKFPEKNIFSKITLEFYLIHILIMNAARVYQWNWKDYYTVAFFLLTLLLSFGIKRITEHIYTKVM